jgi:hypothetical protein
MGITLKDLGNFATGAIERDRELTDKALEDRREQLKSNREAILAMKAKRYDSEIKDFEKENAKYQAIKSVNNQFEGQEITPSQWGQAYLKETDAATYNNLIKTYADDVVGLNEAFSKYYSPNLSKFKLSTTRDAIENKTQEEIKSINADYNDKIKNARGDSFLIAQLLGQKNKQINDVEKKATEDSTGVKVAKEVNTQQPDSTEPNFTIKEEPITFRVPKKYIEDAKLEEKRTKINSDDAQEGYSKAAVNATLNFFSENKITKPQVFYKKNQQTNQVEGFEGAGATLNDHISDLWGGAADGFTDEKVYIATNKKSSYASNVLNSANIKNKIDERIRNYTHIEQPKTWFKDTESIVGIVPWSIVDVNDTIGSYQLKTKNNKKALAKIYVDVLKEYTAENNKTADGTIIESNQKFMNDLQSELLQLRGSESALSKDIQSRILSKMGLKDNNVKVQTQTGTGSVVIDGKNIPLTESNKKYLDSIGYDYSNAIKDTPNQNNNQIVQEGGDGSTAEQIYGVNKDIPKKVEPSELGDTKFTNLESVLKVLPKGTVMTGEEIKDTYNIDFPINPKSKFKSLQ